VRGATAVLGVSRALSDAQGPAAIQRLSMEGHLASENLLSGFRAPYSVQVAVKLRSHSHDRLNDTK